MEWTRVTRGAAGGHVIDRIQADDILQTIAVDIGRSHKRASGPPTSFARSGLVRAHFAQVPQRLAIRAPQYPGFVAVHGAAAGGDPYIVALGVVVASDPTS